MSRTTHYIALSGLVLVATAWGGTFVMIKAVLAEITPEWFIFYRFLLAGMILLPFVLKQLDRAALRMGTILGLLVFSGYWLQTTGLKFTTPSRSAFVTGAGIVLVPVFDRIIYRTRMPAAALAGVVMAFGGLFFLFGGLSGSLNSGDVLTIGCAIAFSIHIVLTSRYSELRGPMVLTAVQLLVTAVCAAPTLAFAPARPFTGFGIFAIVFSAVVTTALAFIILIWAQARVSATEAAIALSFEPVAAGITSVVFAGEQATAGSLLGGLLVVGGIIFSQLQPSKVEE